MQNTKVQKQIKNTPDKLSGNKAYKKQNENQTSFEVRLVASRILTQGVNIPRLADKSQPDRSVILLVSNKSISSWARCAYANQKICAHGAICARSLECEHSDSASLDYVASGSTGRAVSSSRLNGATTKRGNRKGCLFLLVELA